jgi:hypothetical protein
LTIVSVEDPWVRAVIATGCSRQRADRWLG